MLAVTAVSGFPKPGYTGYNIENILKGQIGDDAYFVARHVDEWSTGDDAFRAEVPEPTVTRPEEERQTNLKRRGNADVIGVADGVGGWRQYGVDPGLFSSHLMKSCERLVHAGFFQANTPSKLLEQVRDLPYPHLLLVHLRRGPHPLHRHDLGPIWRHLPPAQFPWSKNLNFLGLYLMALGAGLPGDAGEQAADRRFQHRLPHDALSL
jgi:hypothetical protein